MSSPTQRALAVLKRRHWCCQVVERWQPQAMKRIDLFGIIDLLAMKDGLLLAIQVTSTSGMSSRLDKALSEPRLDQWLLTGSLFEVWGFSKKGAKDKRKLWMLDRQPIIGSRDLVPFLGGSTVRPAIIHPRWADA